MEPLLPVLPRGSGLVPAGPAESESQWPGGGLDAARHREHRLPRRVGHFSLPSRPACRRGGTKSDRHDGVRFGLQVRPVQVVTVGPDQADILRSPRPCPIRALAMLSVP